jgi:hypothetical protein
MCPLAARGTAPAMVAGGAGARIVASPDYVSCPLPATSAGFIREYLPG